jgi:predicted transport protein
MATPEEMAQKMAENLKQNTGKSLAQWAKAAKASGLTKHGEVVKFLKEEHGLGHGYANLVAHEMKGQAGAASGAMASAGEGDDLVAAQYAGAKADLRPIYDALIKKVMTFGKDVEVSPKKAYVSLRRSKQFALIQPSTKTRVDVGIQFKEPPKTVTDRLEASGSFNTMVSHRVRLERVEDIDTEVVAYLREAYEKA